MTLKKILSYIFIIPMFMAVALVALSGCEKDRSIDEVQSLYNQMVQSYNVGDSNEMFTDGDFDIKYDIDYMNQSRSQLLSSALSDGLKISYIQINSLYNNVLKLSNAFYENFSDYIYENQDLNLDSKKVTVLYNRLVNLNKEATLFYEAKSNLEDIAINMDSATSNTFENRLKKFNYSYGNLITKNLEFVSAFEDLFNDVYVADSSILDMQDGTVDKQFYINSLLCKGYLRYSQLIYNEIIEPNMRNNACDTKSLQFVSANMLSTYNNYITGISNWDNSTMSLFNGDNVDLFDQTTTTSLQVDYAKRLAYSIDMFDKYYVFYSQSIDSLDYQELKDYRLKSVVENNQEVYTNYIETLTTVDNANLEIVNDFLGNQAAGMFQLLLLLA